MVFLATSGSPTPPDSRLFIDASTAGVALATTLALGSAILFLFRSKHRDVDGYALALNQIASTEFVRLVVRESRRVFAIVDKHLPSVLSQELSDSPPRSRFDQFCEAVRRIPDSELDDRGKYSQIVKIVFDGIISANVTRLLDTLDANDTALQHAILNPTRASFSLEERTFQRFAAISKFDSRNRRIESWFRRAWVATAVLLIVPFVAALSVLLSTTIRQPWGESLWAWAVWFTVGGAAAAAMTYLASFVLKQMLARRAREYGDPEVINKYVSEETTKNDSENN